MKNKFISLFILATLIFSACSDEKKGTIDDNGDKKAVHLQIKSNTQENARSDEPSQSGQSAPLLSALIYFMDDSTDPIVYASRTAGEYNADITMAQLEAGYEFDNIPSAVTQVYVVGNYNSSDAQGNTADFPTAAGTTYNQIRGVVLNIQEVAFGELSNGSTSSVLLAVMDGISPIYDYTTTPGNWTGTATLTAGDTYASVEISPLVSRIEIENLRYTGTFQSFTVEGIYINYYYANRPVSLQTTGYAVTNNGSMTANYEEGNPAFKYTDYTTLYDIIDQPVTPTPATPITISPTNGTWAYHVFGNSTPVPHIIIKLTDVIDANGTTLGTRYVTVTGYTNASTGEVTTFARNTIYQIEYLDFSDNDTSIIPEPEFISLWVNVTVADWITVAVSPII